MYSPIISALKLGSNIVSGLSSYAQKQKEKKQQQQNTIEDYRSYGSPSSNRNTGSAMDLYRAEQERNQSRTNVPGTLPTARSRESSIPVSTVSGTPVSSGTQSSYTAPQQSYTAPQQDSAALTKLKTEQALSNAMGSKNYVASLRSGNVSESGAGKLPRPETTYSLQGGPAKITSQTQSPSVIDRLRSQISTLSQSSAEEQALQDELNAFRESAQLGISAKEGQGRGIPLSLVRGEQALLGEQAGIKEQSLLDRLANATAKRQAALTAAQNEYTIAADQQARQDKLTAPITAGSNILQFDPVTGQYKTVYSAPAEAAEYPTSVQEYQYAANSGYTGSYTDFLAAKAAFSQSPANYQYTAGGIFNPNTGVLTPATSTQTGISALGQQALTLVGELISDPGREGATGAFNLFSNIPGTPSYDYKAKLQRLQSLLSLDSIKYLKGTGAISDREGAILENAAASLKPGMSEEAFLKELKRIQADLEAASTPATSNDYSSLLQQGLITQEEYNELSGSFSNDLSMSQNGSRAIASVTTNYPPGSYGAQCGRFVNRLTGLKMGNTYESKMAYADRSIGTTNNPVQPGDVFIMPYKQFGHTGFIDDRPWIPKPDGTFDIPVVDSNWNLDEKVSRHYINSSKISGFARAPVTSQKVSLS